jgi:hypothetical protein
MISGIRAVTRFSRLLVSLSALAALSFAKPVGAAEIAGVKLEPTVRVGNQDLKLNGAGIRHRAIFKVYVAGLYLPEVRKSPPEILTLPGARRVTLVMLRDLSNEELARAFIAGVTKNSNRDENAKIIPQLQTFGEIFASIPELKKGDVLTTDWVPGSGTVIHVNGKKIAEPIPDLAFYNALLRIWLGEKPADAGLKTALLGGE